MLPQRSAILGFPVTSPSLIRLNLFVVMPLSLALTVLGMVLGARAVAQYTNIHLVLVLLFVFAAALDMEFNRGKKGKLKLGLPAPIRRVFFWALAGFALYVYSAEGVTWKTVAIGALIAMWVVAGAGSLVRKATAKATS